MSVIREKLPIDVTDEELEKYPQFLELLTQLCEKVQPSGVSHPMQRSLDLAQRNLSQTRHEWMMKSVIYHELGETLSELEIRGQEGTLSLDEKQFKHILSKTLAYSELGDYLHFLPSVTSTSTLFGLTEGDVEKHNPVKHHLPAVQQMVVPMIEERLRKKCEELYNFFDPSNETVSDYLLVAKSQALPAMVEKKQQDLIHEKEIVKQTRARRDKQFWTYYQQLLECLSVMETLIMDFKLKKQTSIDDTSVAWLKAKSDALCLKVRLTQLRIICDTYTTETVKALRKIEGHLDAAIKQTERELASTTQSLNNYHAIGEEFKTLVTQFAQLQQEIDNRKWGLFQLGKQSGGTVTAAGSDDDADVGSVRAVISSDSLEQTTGESEHQVGKAGGDVIGAVGGGVSSGFGQGAIPKTRKTSKTVTFNPLFETSEEYDLNP